MSVQGSNSTRSRSSQHTPYILFLNMTRASFALCCRHIKILHQSKLHSHFCQSPALTSLLQVLTFLQHFLHRLSTRCSAVLYTGVSGMHPVRVLPSHPQVAAPSPPASPQQPRETRATIGHEGSRQAGVGWASQLPLDKTYQFFNISHSWYHGT